jgi:hypothetical protein
MAFPDDRFVLVFVLIFVLAALPRLTVNVPLTGPPSKG